MRLALLGLMLVASTARADDAYLVDHPDAAWWLSAQANFILQAQPGFHSPYKGDNSLVPSDHAQLSYVATVFAGYELTPTTTIIVTGESAGGGGLSTALGLAGFTNLDVVRNPSLGPTPYVGTAMIDQIIPLGDSAPSDRNPLRIFHRVPPHRIEMRAGKMGTVYYFDNNSVGTDSHYQFMNWTVDNNGAYDYAADTRGYTLGAEIEYDAPLWAVRYGAMLMPTVANGIDYDFDLANARGEQLEVEAHDCIAGHPGIVRALAFWNHAKMGRYSEAIASVRQGIVDLPDVTATREKGRLKYGFGLNAEQEIVENVHGFVRLGWNEGENESFAYTEVDNTVLAGGDYKRGDGKLGVAFVTNGISQAHRDYLQLGGKGFLLGDGTLHYGRENILEAYYTRRVYKGVFPAVDLQLIQNPGYNTDRGPVAVGSLRLHIEI
ncbi:MAG: carbohydrate porin [Deltaproteobacteria bacterium]|nr:carbohydrate porin [Deltaproteobacteria bacterium]